MTSVVSHTITIPAKRARGRSREATRTGNGKHSLLDLYQRIRSGITLDELILHESDLSGCPSTSVSIDFESQHGLFELHDSATFLGYVARLRPTVKEINYGSPMPKNLSDLASRHNSRRLRLHWDAEHMPANCHYSVEGVDHAANLLVALNAEPASENQQLISAMRSKSP
jgi:hypothetical protein